MFTIVELRVKVKEEFGQGASQVKARFNDTL